MHLTCNYTYRSVYTRPGTLQVLHCMQMQDYSDLSLDFILPCPQYDLITALLGNPEPRNGNAIRFSFTQNTSRSPCHPHRRHQSPCFPPSHQHGIRCCTACFSPYQKQMQLQCLPLFSLLLFHFLRNNSSVFLRIN